MPRIDLHAIYRVGGKCEYLNDSIKSIQEHCSSVTVLYETKDRSNVTKWSKNLPPKVTFLEYMCEVYNFNDARNSLMGDDDPRRFDNFTNYALAKKRDKWVMLIDDDMIFHKKGMTNFLSKCSSKGKNFDCFPYFGLNVLDVDANTVVKGNEIQPADHALFYNYGWVIDRLDLDTGMENLPHVDSRFKRKYFLIAPIYKHYKYLRSDAISRSVEKKYLRTDTLVGSLYSKQIDVDALDRRKLKIWKLKFWSKQILISSHLVLSFVKVVRKMLEH